MTEEPPTIRPILVVDDHPDLRLLIKTILRRKGFPCIDVESVDKAIGVLKTQPVSIILSDISMPLRSGFDLIRVIRTNSFPTIDASIPAAAISAFNDEKSRKRSIDEGFCEHLCKPFTESELIDLVKRLTNLSNEKIVSTSL